MQRPSRSLSAPGTSAIATQCHHHDSSFAASSWQRTADHRGEWGRGGVQGQCGEVVPTLLGRSASEMKIEGCWMALGGGGCLHPPPAFVWGAPSENPTSKVTTLNHDSAICQWPAAVISVTSPPPNGQCARMDRRAAIAITKSDSGSLASRQRLLT